MGDEPEVRLWQALSKIISILDNQVLCITESKCFFARLQIKLILGKCICGCVGKRIGEVVQPRSGLVKWRTMGRW